MNDMPVTGYFAGLDLGQPQDFAALAVLAQQVVEDQFACAVRHLNRWPPGTAYAHMAADVGRLLEAAELGGGRLVIDQTAVGRAAVAPFLDLGLGRTRRVVITAGHVLSVANDGVTHLPKKELVSLMQALLQTKQWQC
jgi:hypothetical protein